MVVGDVGSSGDVVVGVTSRCLIFSNSVSF